MAYKHASFLYVHLDPSCMSQDGTPHRFVGTPVGTPSNVSEGLSLHLAILRHCCCWETVLQHLVGMQGTPDLVHQLAESMVLLTVKEPCQ